MADIDFSQAFTYSDINKVYLMAVELSGGLVTQHGSVQLESIFQDSTLYAQVSALKTEMESILQNFTGASEYDDTATYAVGDYCTRNDYLYQCNTPVSAESWDASKWDVVTISSQYSEVYTMLTNILGVDDYSTSASYAVGDLVVHDGKLYRCTTAVSSEAWDDGKWSETSFVAESESIITEIRTEGDAQVAAVQSVYAEDLAEINARVSRNTKAIANLVQKEGVVSISYPDSVYGRGEVPSGMAKFAEVSCLRGVSRVGNQLLDKSFGSSTTINNVTFTNNGDGSWSISTNGTASGTAYVQLCNDVPTLGHKWLIAGCPSGGSGLSGFTLWDASNSAYDNGSGVVFSPTNAINVYIRVASGTSIPTPIVYWPVLTDLNVYFGGTVPSNALTIADIQQNYPELLVPSDYDAGSIVDITYSAVESEGVNIWDEEWEVGSINSTTGEDATNPNTIRSKNFIRVVPSTAYYCKADSLGTAEVAIFYYDINMNFISLVGGGNASWTTPSNAYFVRFFCAAAYGTTYKHDIQICLNSYTDKTVYHPHFKSTLTLPSPVTLRSAGSVADTDELCVEVSEGVFKRRQTRRVGSYTFTGNETPTSSYQRTNGDWYCVFQSIFNGGKDSGEGLSDKGIPFTTGNIAYDGTGSYFVTRGSGGLAFYLAGATSASAVMAWISANLPKVQYELADPVVTLTDPILDNFVLTEAGGTITPKQTQTKKIDARFDMNYMAL